MTEAITHEKPAKFLEHYGAWDIYQIREAYIQHPSLLVTPLLVAVHPKTHHIILGVDKPNLQADIYESEHNKLKRIIYSPEFIRKNVF